MSLYASYSNYHLHICKQYCSHGDKMAITYFSYNVTRPAGLNVSKSTLYAAYGLSILVAFKLFYPYASTSSYMLHIEAVYNSTRLITLEIVRPIVETVRQTAENIIVTLLALKDAAEAWIQLRQFLEESTE